MSPISRRLEITQGCLIRPRLHTIGVGGTTISRDQTTGAFQGEATWNSSYSFTGTGGGPSLYEARPSYQNGISAIVGSARGTPDVAAIADPNTGVWVYNNYSAGGWFGAGGTSAATPIVAGIVNRSGFFWTSSLQALTEIYLLASEGKLVGSLTTDINNGVCGPGGSLGFTNGSTTYPYALGEGYNPQFTESATGLAWDFCSGWGTPRGNQ